MSRYIMMGKYHEDSIKSANPNRTEKAGRLIHELGGEVIDIYALLGNFDLVVIVELENEKIAMKASLGLSALTGISFSTYPAVSISDFDRIIGDA